MNQLIRRHPPVTSTVLASASGPSVYDFDRRTFHHSSYEGAHGAPAFFPSDATLPTVSDAPLATPTPKNKPSDASGVSTASVSPAPSATKLTILPAMDTKTMTDLLAGPSSNGAGRKNAAAEAVLRSLDAMDVDSMSPDAIDSTITNILSSQAGLLGDDGDDEDAAMIEAEALEAYGEDDGEFDPVLDVAPGRGPNQLKPILFPVIWKFYTDSQSSIWFASELKFLNDRTNWHSGVIPERFKRIMTRQLSFLSGADSVVLKGLVSYITTNVKMMEAQMFFGVQVYQETKHVEAYNLMIEELDLGPDEEARVFGSKTGAALSTPTSTSASSDDDAAHLDDYSDEDRKNLWALKHIYARSTSKRRMGLSLVGLVATECIFFMSTFVSFDYVKHKSWGIGMAQTNDYVKGDEETHGDHGITLHNMLKPRHRATPSQIRTILTEAVDIEKAYCSNTFRLAGGGYAEINEANVFKHIECQANRVSVKLGAGLIYPESIITPFAFMYSRTNKTNQFEGKDTNYRIATASKDDSIESQVNDDVLLAFGIDTTKQ
jgi:ribonucleotide reductase beta subunit family protein with ferritin-like domain